MTHLILDTYTFVEKTPVPGEKILVIDGGEYMITKFVNDAQHGDVLEGVENYVAIEKNMKWCELP